MFPYSKQCIVVPVDFSDRSFRAVDAALKLADAAEHVQIVYVLPRLEVNDPGVIWNTVDDNARRTHAIESLTKAFSEEKYAGIQIEIRFGDPGKQIVELAREKSADLIIMPSHGRSGLHRILLGSVADRVARLATCPVLIMRG